MSEIAPSPIRLGVLISGGGTTMLNFLEKIAAGELPAEIGLVIASRSDVVQKIDAPKSASPRPTSATDAVHLEAYL